LAKGEKNSFPRSQFDYVRRPGHGGAFQGKWGLLGSRFCKFSAEFEHGADLV